MAAGDRGAGDAARRDEAGDAAREGVGDTRVFGFPTAVALPDDGGGCGGGVCARVLPAAGVLAVLPGAGLALAPMPAAASAETWVSDLEEAAEAAEDGGDAVVASFLVPGVVGFVVLPRNAARAPTALGGVSL